MTHVHYKFSSKLSYDTVLFDGPHVTLRELKRLIMGRERLRAADCDLRITNAQSKEEYTEDDDLVPKGSSVIVRRIPVIGGKSGSICKTKTIEGPAVVPHAFGLRAMDDHGSSGAFLAKMTNLAEADASEEDKIKVMLNQSTYDSMSYKKFGTVLPANYTCYRCGNTGHHIRNCPTSGDKSLEAPLRIRKSTGIPRSFMVEVDDPNMKGAMLTNTGRYAIPTIDAEAYAIGKKEKPPFIPQEKLPLEVEQEPVPDELLCLICRDLLSDAVVIPCCGNSYCDDCIRTNLLDSEEHVCPTCSQSDVSPDTLIANKFLRQAVNNFKKERGYTRTLKRSCAPAQSRSSAPRRSPAPSPSAGKASDPQQDPTQNHPDVTDPSLLSGSAPADSVQPEQSCPEMPEKDEEKTQEESEELVPAPSVLVSNQEPPAPAKLIPVVNHILVVDSPRTGSMTQQLPPPSSSSSSSSSSSFSLCATPSPCAPPSCWTSSSSSSSSAHPSRGWTNSSSFSSSYSAPTPPLFPSPFFLPAQQAHRSLPPGYQPPTPPWPVPGPQGAPISSLCSPTPSSIPSLIPDDWYKHQRKKSERSTHKESSHRHLSKSNSRSSKPKSSRSYSNSSSRSRSRSRSRSHSRSRNQSPYPRHRSLQSRPCSSYSYGYKRSRSPTPSSSSSPRVGYYSRSKSPSDHQKKRHHHSRKSSSGSYGSRRRGDRSERQAGGAETRTNPSAGLDLDRELYLQWQKDYRECCERYFSSYVGHLQQLPLPLLNLLPPPPPPPLWVNREGGENVSYASADPRLQPPGRRPAELDARSPSSRSSSRSRSPPSGSSSDSCSTSSGSFSDSDSSPATSVRRSTASEHRADQQTFGRTNRRDRKETGEEVKMKQLEQKQKKRHKDEREESLSPAGKTRPPPDRYDQWLHDSNVCKDESPGLHLASRLPAMKTSKSVDKHSEREGREKQNPKGERRWRSRYDEDRTHKGKTRREPDIDHRPRGGRSAEPRSERSRKRREDEPKRNETQRKSLSPKPPEKRPEPGKKEENKAQPLMDRDIWEEGIRVKPQKKISININLDGKSMKMDQDGQTWNRNPEELSRNDEGEEEGKPAKVEARRGWETVEGGGRSAVGGENPETVEEQRDGMKARQEEVKTDEPELVHNPQKEAPDGKSTSNHRREELKDQRGHHDGSNTDGSFEDHEEAPVIKPLEENARESSAEPVKLPVFKWDKEAKKGGGAETPEAPPPSLAVTDDQQNEQTRWRSVDAESDAQIHRGGPHGAEDEPRQAGKDGARAPSSGKHKPDRTTFTDRGVEQDKSRGRDRARESERQSDRQKDGKRSNDRRREDERDRGLEGGGPSSSSSTPRDPERREWQPGGDQGCDGKERSSLSTDVDVKSSRDASVDQDRSRTHRDALASESSRPRVSSWELTHNRSKNEECKQNATNAGRRGSRREDGHDNEWGWRRELEEGERPSSRSSNSSSSANLATRDRKKHKKHRKERRRAEPELEPQKKKKKKAGTGEGDGLGDAFP